MTLTLRILGMELLHLEVTTDPGDTDPGDTMATPVGFTRDTGGCEWQVGVER